MKKIYSFLIVSFLISSAFAQITLTSTANTPNVGESYDYFIISNPPMGAGPGGANQTWDFSSLGGTPVIFDYVSLANSTDPSNHPNANIVESIPGGENFYSKSSSGYSLVGQFLPNILRISYTNEREFIPFPITYNDVFNETFSGTVENLQAGQSFARNGDVEITADGFGTLVLPYGTINNVLRVRNVLDYQDMFAGSVVGAYNDTIYTWHHAFNGAQLASRTLGYANGSIYANQITYLGQDDFISAISPSLASQVSIYPNPANTFFILKNATDIEAISIMDLNGKVATTIPFARHQELKIDVSGILPGVYFIRMNAADGIYTEKLVVR